MRVKFDFMNKNTHQSFTQAETVVFGGHSQALSKIFTISEERKEG